MIPDAFTVLDALPRTSTDKIDYQALKLRRRPPKAAPFPFSMPLSLMRKLARFANAEGGSIKARVLRSGFWVGMSNAGINALNLVRSVVLARLLTPDMFGSHGTRAGRAARDRDLHAAGHLAGIDRTPAGFRRRARHCVHDAGDSRLACSR